MKLMMKPTDVLYAYYECTSLTTDGYELTPDRNMIKYKVSFNLRSLSLNESVCRCLSFGLLLLRHNIIVIQSWWRDAGQVQGDTCHILSIERTCVT